MCCGALRWIWHLSGAALDRLSQMQFDDGSYGTFDGNGNIVPTSESISQVVTALCALVLKTGIWPIALAMQTESVAKMPLCIYRVRSRKWIHDVTANKEML